MTVSTGTSSTVFRGTALIVIVSIAHGTTHLAGQGFWNLVPYIQQDLGLTYSQIGLFGFLWQISGFTANFIGAPLVDMTGRRISIMIGALALCAVTLSLIGTADSYLMICGLAVVMGICISTWHPPAISYLSNDFRERRGFAIAMHGSGASLGDALGPVMAGFFVTIVMWRMTTLYIALPMAVMAVFLLVTMMPKDKVQNASGKPGISFREYAIGIKAMIRRPAVAGVCLIAALRAVAQIGLTLFLPVYLVNELGFEPLKTGLVMTCLFAGGIIAAPIMGVVSDRIGRRPVVMAGVGLSTVGIFGLTLVGDPVIFVGAVAVLGFVLFAIRPILHSWLMDMTPPEMGGSATGLMFSTQYLFAMVMSLSGGIIADAYGLIWVFYLMAASMLVANVAILFMPKEEKTGGA